MPSGSDPVPSETKKSRRVSKKAIALTVVLALLFGALATAAYAGYSYSRAYRGKILPGAAIAGVNVGGMTRRQAVRAVTRKIRPSFKRTILTLRWNGHRWKLTPAELGARSNVGPAVHRALELSAHASLARKAGMRLLGQDLGFSRSIAIRYPRARVEAFVRRFASRFDKGATDARIDAHTGWVKIVPEKEGRRVAVAGAVKRGATVVKLPVATIRPTITTASFKKVLLLRIGENRLYLYENGHITHKWTVATGQPRYPTPTGTYKVVSKEKWPWWINPDPNTWGRTMPKKIPPGRDNPLGVRALHWSAPGVAFHGTVETNTLGYNASHGCVRLSNPDVEVLYNLVPVGTTIVSKVVAPFKPLYVPLVVPGQ
jgi:lipoprotein-anchoring transpeptidase ErfK/SrfK